VYHGPRAPVKEKILFFESGRAERTGKRVDCPSMSQTPTFSDLVSLPYGHDRPLPDFQDGDEIRFPDSLARALLERFTRGGDVVLDPFAGLGTTFFAAQDMGRVPYGVEADAQRHAWVTTRTPFAGNLALGDAGDIASLGFPTADLCLTSPPYMPRHHTWNPLYGGDPAHDGYDAYLTRMRDIFRAVCAVMKPGAPVVVQADNLTHAGFSPLVWDLGLALSDVMTLEGEICVVWSDPPRGTRPFTQCLVFRGAA
jgi:hypothetical protein